MRNQSINWMALGLAVFFLVAAAWPLSGLCSGRPLGRDCESWRILGVNLFGPFGLLALACWAWSACTASLMPHVCLAVALVGMLTAIVAAVL